MSVTIVKPKNARICGFCNSGHHSECAVGTRTLGPRAMYPEGAVYLCLCKEGGCKLGRRRCTECKNRNTEEVSSDTWKCLDQEGCQATLETRRRANPLYAELRDAYRSSDMAKIEKKAETKAKAEKAPKEPTFCLVTGEPTKGGLFKPGMDARYVSNLVEAVTSKNTTEAKAKAQMKSDGVSEKLVAKFEKSLGLAKEKAEKQAAAAKEKAAAKAEKTAK